MLSPEDRDAIRRGEQIYAERLKDELEPAHLDEYVVIEPESGDYFLGATMSQAAAAARAAHPGRPGFLMRVGHRAAVHLGGYHDRQSG